jgi:hypothetical protein
LTLKFIGPGLGIFGLKPGKLDHARGCSQPIGDHPVAKFIGPGLGLLDVET